jgi:hypothetical protein
VDNEAFKYDENDDGMQISEDDCCIDLDKS